MEGCKAQMGFELTITGIDRELTIIGIDRELTIMGIDRELTIMGGDSNAYIGEGSERLRVAGKYGLPDRHRQEKSGRACWICGRRTS